MSSCTLEFLETFCCRRLMRSMPSSYASVFDSNTYHTAAKHTTEMKTRSTCRMEKPFSLIFRADFRRRIGFKYLLSKRWNLQRDETFVVIFSVNSSTSREATKPSSPESCLSAELKMSRLMKNVIVIFFLLFVAESNEICKAEKGFFASLCFARICRSNPQIPLPW